MSNPLIKLLEECRGDYVNALGFSKAALQQWTHHMAGKAPNETWGQHCAARIRQIDEALQKPLFKSEQDLADFLDSLHECTEDGGVMPQKWEAAQRARRALLSPAEDAADPDAAAKGYAAMMGERWEDMGEEARQRARRYAAQLEEARKANLDLLVESIEPAGDGGLCCHDCGLPYGSKGYADFVVPDDVWKRISPAGDGGGILCANCMVRRAAELGIECEGAFTSGPFADHGWRKPSGALQNKELAVCMYDDGSAFMLGKVGGYVDKPSYIFSNHDFQTWPASRVRAPTIEEEAKYWRERALQAEAKAGQA